MNALKNAVSRAPRGVFHAAAILVLGCSAGAGDSSQSDDPSTSAVTQELRGRGHSAPPPPHHPAPPPHHPGHGHGDPCNPPGHAGSPGAGGTAGSSSGSGASSNGDGSGGFSSGAGGQSTAGQAGSSEQGGAPSGGGGNFPDPCGDGLQFFNACDDGNTVSGDGCSATCDVEPGFVCTTPGAPCRQQRCGDGFQDYIFVPGDPASSGGVGGVGGAGGFGTYVFEACDDGNTVSGDGCSATCDVEPGFVCTAPGTACHEPRCGDGIQDFISTPGGSAGGAPNGAGGTNVGGAFPDTGGVGGGGGFGVFEGCDDGNTDSGDGCSATCDIEPGFVCGAPGTLCHEPRCGDGIQDFIPGAGGSGAGGSSGGVGGEGTGGSAGGGNFGSFESCDDGNTASGDGCSSSCEIEAGFICIEPNTPCRAPHCGDGILDFFYPGMDTGSGGATGSAGSASAGFGGTGGFEPVEQCDDGNTAPGDGCSATCQFE